MKNKEAINQSRRQFIKKSSITGTALLIGFQLPSCNSNRTDFPTLKADHNNLLEYEPNAWIRISADDTITVIVNHSEMGQGITTALPMIVAEELDADWSKVKAEIAPAESVYKNPTFYTQMTAASTSVRTSWKILRKAGAATRQLLIEAAAQTWQVPVSQCYSDKSRVFHTPSEKVLRYGQLLAQARKLNVPENPVLKNPEDFRLIGTNTPRLDSEIKTTGEAKFGIDIKVPEMLTATVIHPPTFGAELDSFNSDRTMKIPGVKKVVSIDRGVAVVATGFWQALEGARALNIKWTESETIFADDEKIRQRWHQLEKEPGKTRYERGESGDFFENPENDSLQATYILPYQGHATPEPMNCTASVQENRCDVWVPTQHQDATQETASRITGLDYDRVFVHTTYVGGGFGRRISVEHVEEAVQLSKKLKVPIKVIWSREEDTRNDPLRPASYNILKAVLNSRGLPIAWNHKIIGADHMAHQLQKLLPSMLPYWVPRFLRNTITSMAEVFVPRYFPGKMAIEGAIPTPYDIPNVQIDFVNDDPGVPLGFMRSVAHANTAFVVESFLDEIAFSSGKDPFEFRAELLAKSPRALKVLKLAANKAGWGRKRPKGIFRGIAFHDFQDTFLTFVAEVSISESKEIKVHRFVCAVDCGIVINPKIIAAQMESGIAFGLTATLKSEITIKNNRIEQSNFDDFSILTMEEMPEVETYLVKSGEPPTGIGESAVPLIAPAVANAVFAATGKRLRKIPLRLNET